MDGFLNDRTNIKLFILFLLNEINYPLDYSTLADVMAENGYVGSFDFAETFSTLCAAGHILEEDADGKKTYRISQTGQLVASELQDNLLLSIRQKSRKSAMRLLSLRRRGATPFAAYEKRTDGRYTVTCSLTEASGPMLKTELTVTTEEEAERIRARFYQDPDTVFRGLYAVMTGEVDYLLLN